MGWAIPDHPRYPPDALTAPQVRKPIFFDPTFLNEVPE